MLHSERKYSIQWILLCAFIIRPEYQHRNAKYSDFCLVLAQNTDVLKFTGLYPFDTCRSGSLFLCLDCVLKWFIIPLSVTQKKMGSVLCLVSFSFFICSFFSGFFFFFTTFASSLLLTAIQLWECLVSSDCWPAH